MKKILSVFLALCLLISLAATTVAAENTTSKEEIEAAKTAISTAFTNFTPTNNTTKEEVLQFVTKALPAGSRVRIPANLAQFNLTPATESDTGFMEFYMILMCDGNSVQFAKNKSFALSSESTQGKLTEDRNVVTSALSQVKCTNGTTEEDLIKVAKAAIRNGSTFNVDKKATIKKATFDSDGYIEVYFSLSNGSESGLIYKKLVIPMFKKNVKMPNGISLNAREWDIVRYTNIERYKTGAQLLTVISFLQDGCDVREADMCIVWEHTRPDGKPFYTAVAEQYRDSSITENIFMGGTTYEGEITGKDCVDNWMASKMGHKENLLNKAHSVMGAGLSNLDYGVQMFMNKYSPIVKVESSTGSFTFDNEEKLYTEYLTCTLEDGTVTYMPLDGRCMANENGSYVLTLRGNKKITFKIQKEAISVPQSPITFDEPKKEGFIDVPSSAYYSSAVAWAVEKNITAGTSATTFSPDKTCTRAQIITFLWRAAGSPNPNMPLNTFRDVKSSDYYYSAALWALTKGMVSGEYFKPDTPCTRSATVIYLWKNAGSPNASKAASFDDVPAGSEYAEAVSWAVEKGVTTGTSATTFSPDTTCTRGQIVTFLNRAFK